MDKVKTAIIIEKLSEKIAILTRYRELTGKMVNANLDTLAELIAERQLIIPKIDEATAIISEATDTQNEPTKVLLREILTFKNPKVSDEFADILTKAKELEAVLLEILALEEIVNVTISNIKQELSADMQKISKGKQIIEYVNSASGDIPSGEKYNNLS